MQFDHINITAPANLLALEKEFFCKAFQLVVGFRPQFKRAGFWLYHNDKALVHLTECKNEAVSEIVRVNNRDMPQVPSSKLDHIAFSLDDTAQLLNVLSNFKLEYEITQLDELSMTQIFFTSPAGAPLEVNCKN